MLRLLAEPARTGPLLRDRPSLRAKLRAGRGLVLELRDRRVRRRTACPPAPPPPGAPAAPRPSRRRAPGLDRAAPLTLPYRHSQLVLAGWRALASRGGSGGRLGVLQGLGLPPAAAQDRHAEKRVK